MKRWTSMLIVTTMIAFAMPTVFSIAADEAIPRATVQLEAGEPTFTDTLPADDFIGEPTDNGPVVQLDAVAEAHNYYTCRRDFHYYNGWFIEYLGWYWKMRDGASRQVYVHRHIIYKPISAHFRQTWCT